MMRIILLLLVALTGPFCTFTSASTLVVPTASDLNVTAIVKSDQPAVTEKTEEPTALPTVVTVSAVTEVSATMANTPVVTTVQAQPNVSETANTTASTTSEATDNKTTEEPLSTTVIHEVPTLKTYNDTEIEPEKDVKIEEAMGTGQLVGIVIGALIAVIVVIAVIILVVRRMGQYSPAKKLKPQKQEDIFSIAYSMGRSRTGSTPDPLTLAMKRKSADKQEKKKFWMF